MNARDDHWLIGKAVVPGTGHLDQGSPCQDYCEIETSADGRWLVASVSDGAGSAARGGEGAQTVTRWVTRELIGQIDEIERRGPGVWLKDRVHAILLDAREALRAAGASIYDFHCTLVGVLVGPTGGFFFHVGDGAAMASRAQIIETPDPEPQLQLWNGVILSAPENGEYANETFFITQDDWIKHLRGEILPPEANVIALMSDGAMPFLILRQQINSPFIDPVIGQLLRAEDGPTRDALLHKHLNAEDARAVTDDDKTLMIALRKTLTDYKIVASEADQVALSAKPAAAVSVVQPVRSETQVGEPVKGGVHSVLALAIAVAALVLALASLGLSAFVYREAQRGALPTPGAAEPAGQGHGANRSPPVDRGTDQALPKPDESAPPPLRQRDDVNRSPPVDRASEPALPKPDEWTPPVK